MLRAAVRELAEDRIAPRAAEIDETGEFPWDVYEVLRANDFHAIHIPEQFGGEGGDALAACLVIEEVARVCTSSSLIPAVNKLGTMPLIVGASDELLGRYLPQVASGEAMFSYALSEREAGSDAGSMKCRAVAGDGGWVLNGQKSWITNAGISRYYTVMAVTEPGVGPRGISAFVVHADDPGFSLGTPERKLGIHGSPTREIYFEDCWIPADRIVGEPGTGFQTAMRTLDHTRVTIGAQALGIAQGALDAVDRLRQGPQAVRQVDRLLPGPAVPPGRHGHEGRDRPGADLCGRRAQRARRRRPAVLRRRRQVLRLGHRDGGHHRRRPGVRRCRAMCATTPSSATCATRRSPRSTRAPTRSSAWSWRDSSSSRSALATTPHSAPLQHSCSGPGRSRSAQPEHECPAGAGVPPGRRLSRRASPERSNRRVPGTAPHRAIRSRDGSCRARTARHGSIPVEPTRGGMNERDQLL